MFELRGRKVPAEPYEFQRDLPRKIDEGLHILVAPTGSGKTYAVIETFRQGYLDKWPRMFHVIPTRSLAKAFFEDYVFNYIGEGKYIGRDLAEAQGIRIGLEMGRHPGTKKFFSTDIIISLRDAFIYTLVGKRVHGRYLDIPFGNVAGSLVVLDEVQMLQDEYAFGPTLMKHLVNVLLDAGATVFIITATMPSKYVELLKDFEPKVYVVGNENPYEHLNVDVQLYQNDVKRIAERRVSGENFRVSVETVEVMDGSGEKIVDRLVERASERYNNGKTLLVFNTVSKAIMAYEKLSQRVPKDDLLLIHSRFTAKDREEKEKMLSKARLIVATQVVEAGLDLEVKYVGTEIAPMDALIQRLGRAGRRKDIGQVEALVVVPKIPEEPPKQEDKSGNKNKKGKGSSGKDTLQRIFAPYANYFGKEEVEKEFEILSENESLLGRAMIDAGLATKLVDAIFELIYRNISMNVKVRDSVYATLAASIIALETLSVNAYPKDIKARPGNYVEVIPKIIADRLGKKVEKNELEKHLIRLSELVAKNYNTVGAYKLNVDEKGNKEYEYVNIKDNPLKLYARGYYPVIEGMYDREKGLVAVEKKDDEEKGKGKSSSKRRKKG